MSSQSDQEIQKKISDLDEKIEQARKDKKTYSQNEYDEQADTQPSAGAISSARAGSEFLASIFASALIGYGIDYMFETKPWGMLGFMILGFITAVYRANATMQQNNEKTEND